MTAWEYQSITIQKVNPSDPEGYMEGTIAALAERGEAGWELAAIQVVDGRGFDYAILKKRRT